MVRQSVGGTWHESDSEPEDGHGEHAEHDEHDEEMPPEPENSTHMRKKTVARPSQAHVAPYLSKLGRIRKIEVKEKVSMVEAATALLGGEIEMANKYKVFSGIGEEIFFGVEQTNFCARQMKNCCPDCAPWNLDIIWTYGGENSKAFKLQRETTCTCCCFNRPIVDVKDAQSGQPIGSLRDPCACCDLTYDVRDASTKTVLQAKGGCCQWGLCCPLPCGPCSHVRFEVYDTAGAKVGDMNKRVPTCCSFIFADDADNYAVEFGKVSDPNHRALLMALAIFVDFRYFSNNSNDDH